MIQIAAARVGQCLEELNQGFDIRVREFLWRQFVGVRYGAAQFGVPLEGGYKVTALDRDVSGVADLEGRDDVTIVEFDLETGEAFPFAPNSFDGIIVADYLWRPGLQDIVSAIRMDGLFIYATFAAGHTHKGGRPLRPDYLLRPNELLEVVTPSLYVVGFEHGAVEEDDHDWIVQRIAACGPDHRWAGRWPLSG